MTTYQEDYRLGDGCSIKHGYAFKGANMTVERSDRPVVVNIVNFQYEGGFRFGSTKIQRHIPGPVEGYELSPGDVLLVMTCQTPGGEILGVPGRIPDDGDNYLHNQRLGKLELNRPDELDSGFLYYLFLSRPFNQHLVATATGAKILHTAPKRIEDFRFARPPLPTQRRIASILSAYDDLIENNTKRIEILEEMARSLYREWFVHFRFPGHEKVKLVDSELGKIPEGWEVDSCDSICELIVDSEHKTAPTQDEGYPSIRTPNIGRGHLLLDGVRRVSEETYEKWTRRAVPGEGDLILAREAPVGNVAIVPRDVFPCLGQRTVLLRANREKMSPHLLLRILLGDRCQDYFTGRSSGATVAHLNLKDLRGLKISVPETEVQSRTAPTFETIDSQIACLFKKNAVLRQTRDLLLPKLISGEIDVDALDLPEAS